MEGKKVMLLEEHGTVTSRHRPTNQPTDRQIDWFTGKLQFYSTMHRSLSFNGFGVLSPTTSSSNTCSLMFRQDESQPLFSPRYRLVSKQINSTEISTTKVKAAHESDYDRAVVMFAGKEWAKKQKLVHINNLLSKQIFHIFDLCLV